ncbi:MAG TPA: hypothetical protein VLZ75_02995 [Chitinophagales bacterium]|nr:hypothetical protein [Chitinophagales bacterium]
MIEIIEQPNLFAFANTPILYKVKSDNLSTHYNAKYQYRYLLSNTGWGIGATFTLKLYFNDNGKPLELFFRAGLLDGFRIGYTITDFDSILISSSQLCQDLLKNNTLNAYVEVERVIVGTRYFIVFTPKTDDIIKVEFETNFQYETKMEILPITNIRDNYKIVAELISQRYEENIQSRYDTIHSSVGYLNADNEAIFDFSSSVSNVLSNNTFDSFFQSIVSDNTAVSWRGELKFGVHVYETWIDADGNDVVGDHIMSSYSSMLQNGLQGIDKLLGINFFDINDGYNLLSYQPRIKIVSKEDIDFLPFFLKNRNSSLVIKISVEYKSEGTPTVFLKPVTNTRQSSVFIVPSGFNQLKLDDLIDPLKVMISYEVQLQTSGGVALSESVKYYLDYKYYETNNSFIYLNSLGVPEAINLKGIKTTTSEVERKILRMPQVDGQLSQFAHLVTTSYKLASGNHFSKVMFKSIDELITSNQTYEVLNGVIAPIIVSNSGTTEYTEKNNILEFVLEYAPAIKGGVMLSEFYKRLSVNRSVCRTSHYVSLGGIEGLITLDVGNSYDSKNHILEDDADVEYTFTLLRPNPVTVVIAGEFRQSFSSSEYAKLFQVGITEYSSTGPLYYYDLLGLIKNELRNPAHAFPIQVSCRVRQKSIGDEWSLPKIVTIPTLEITSMYKSIPDIVKCGNYIFGVNNSCVFMVDDRGRRTTIAGSLTDYGYVTGLGKDSLFGNLTSIVVDKKDIRFGFPTIYVYDQSSNKILKIYKTAIPQPEWYVSLLFQFSDFAVRNLSIHPALRYDLDKPVFLVSEAYGVPKGSSICTIHMNTLTKIILVNLTNSRNIADGDSTKSKCYYITSLKMTSEKELVFVEFGYTGKTAIVRIALANITAFTPTDKINQLNNPTSWTVKTIAGAGSTVNTYADINSVATGGAPIVLGNSANSMRLFPIINKIIKHDNSFYIAAGNSNVILKLTKQEGVVGYEPYYYKAEIFTGKSDEAGYFYDIPQMTLLNQPVGITSDDKYLYTTQSQNGQIVKISLKDGTSSVFSGEGTYSRARDWGLQ